MNEIPSCWYCSGCPDAEDHQRPSSRGGSDDPSNIVDACSTCNAVKGAKTIEEFRAYVARLNGMLVTQVRFHGEGGRTFSRVRGRAPAETATIKVTSHVYEALLALQQELREVGLDVIPDELRDPGNSISLGALVAMSVRAARAAMHKEVAR